MVQISMNILVTGGAVTNGVGIFCGSKKDVLLIGRLMYKDYNKTVSLSCKRLIYETWLGNE